MHLRGRIVSAAHDIDDGVVSVEGERITGVRTASEWMAAHPDWARLPHWGTLLPGLVDIHNHGGAGHRFDTVDQEEAAAAAAFHRGRGTTTMLAGIVTAAPGVMVDQVAVLRELAADGVVGGIHVEGPFLSGSRCGAHDPRLLLDPDPVLARRLLAAAGGHLRVMTIAPERPGFAGVARLLAEQGVTVSLGHSDAGFEDFRNGLRPGGPGSSVTHLGNGMPPMHHRSAGPVAAALTAAAQGQSAVELIGDGVHVDSGFAAMVFATARDRVALVTDAMAAAGMPDGVYRLGPQEVRVSDGVARVAGGSIAGGTADLLRCVAWVVRECGVPLRDAVRAATLTPAATAGLADVGELRAGAYADLIVVDDELRLRRVLHRGRWVS
ncbi:N-acetylglucosamine-6-phosphate deacetylase [Nocardia sp. NPDC127526]|uniref:N-acetylglucosamine-6-phosphate deacetylase n=1 Tax=Nocardia sp. NPDC127526 TaxID=3345393 RepID=UPI00362FCFC9